MNEPKFVVAFYVDDDNDLACSARGDLSDEEDREVIVATLLKLANSITETSGTYHHGKALH